MQYAQLCSAGQYFTAATQALNTSCCKNLQKHNH